MNRRDFLLGSAAVSCLAAAGRGVAAPSSSGRILFGVCTSSATDVGLMRDIGYDFWEWNASEAFDPSKDDEWWKRRKDEIASRALPLRCCNGFIPSKFRLTGPKADHAPALDYAEKVLRRADEVGVKAVVFGSGGARNVPGDFVEGRAPDLEKGVRQFTLFCKALASRVSDLKSVRVAIEPLRPNESNIINYVFQGQSVCREVSSPRITLLADIFHMMMGGDDPEAIVKAGALLTHVHIAEYSSRKFPGNNPSLDGKMAPFFKALSKAGYAGGVSCECGWGPGAERAKNLETALKTMKGMI